MKIIVQSKTLQITQALRDFVESQAEKMIRRGQRITSITVFLEKVARKKSDNDATAAKICVNVPGKTLCVSRNAHDLYQAVTDAVDRTDRVLRKMKEKRLQSKRSQSRRGNQSYVRPAFSMQTY